MTSGARSVQCHDTYVPGAERPTMRGWWAVAAWLQDKLNVLGLTLWMITIEITNQGREGPMLDPAERRTVVSGRAAPREQQGAQQRVM